jgi:hypothetical protein
MERKSLLKTLQNFWEIFVSRGRTRQIRSRMTIFPRLFKVLLVPTFIVALCSELAFAQSEKPQRCADLNAAVFSLMTTAAGMYGYFWGVSMFLEGADQDTIKKVSNTFSLIIKSPPNSEARTRKQEMDKQITDKVREIQKAAGC